MLKHKLVDFIIQFMEEVDKEISEMKLFVRPGVHRLSHNSLGVSSPPDCNCLTVRVVERAGKICGRIVPDSGLHTYTS